MEKKKNNLIYVFILIIVLLSAFGLFVFKKYPTSQTVTDNSPFTVGQKPANLSVNSDWLSFNTEAPFTFSYPPSWGIEAIRDLTDKQGVHVVGSEGEIFMYWGSGFGGACDEKSMKPLKLKDETLTVCDEVTQGAEEWRLISKQITPEVGFDARAYANPPADKNREMILAILATLAFKK